MMRLRFFYLVLMTFTFPVFGQWEQQVRQTSWQFRQDSSLEWQTASKSTYQFDAYHNQTDAYYYDWHDRRLYLSSEAHREYDHQQRLISVKHTNYAPDRPGWPQTRFHFTYRWQGDVIIEETQESWEQDGYYSYNNQKGIWGEGTWERYRYSVNPDGEKNGLLSRTRFNDVGEREYEYFRLEVPGETTESERFYFYTDNHCLQSRVSRSNETGTWLPSDSTAYNYDQDCRVIEEFLYGYLNGWQLQHHKRFEYQVDNNGNLLEKQVLEQRGNEWVLVNLERYAFDDEGFKILNYLENENGQATRERTAYYDDHLVKQQWFEYRESPEDDWTTMARIRERYNVREYLLYRGIWELIEEPGGLILTSEDSIILNSEFREKIRYNYFRYDNGNYTRRRFDYTYRCDGVLLNKVETITDQVAANINVGRQERYLLEYIGPADCEPNPFDEITVFPNPADLYITVALPGSREVQVRITSLSGREVMDRRMSGFTYFTIDVSWISAGTYIVGIDDGTNRQSSLLVIRH